MLHVYPLPPLLKIAPAELPRQLAAGLKPLYLVLGEEPLGAIEAADAVRAAARKSGFDERVSLVAEPGFQWERLAAEVSTGSLFGARRVLDLLVPNGKPDIAGGRALAKYAAAPVEDVLLLATLPGADRKTASTAWAKAVAQAGVVVECRPLKAAQLPRWIAARLKARGLRVPRGAEALIAEYTEGNPLAAAQAVERLALLASDGAVDLESVRAAAVDEARFGLFECVDTALTGDRVRTLRMLARLRDTGSEPTLILWALARELRQLASWRWAEERGGDRPRIWASRRRLVAAAARRRSARGWQRLLAEAAAVDRVIKGRAVGDPWVGLERLFVALADSPRRRAD